jgi:hypothetical protein
MPLAGDLEQLELDVHRDRSDIVQCYALISNRNDCRIETKFMTAFANEAFNISKDAGFPQTDSITGSL